MITCIFGLTACGSEETYTDYEQRKMDTAIQIATQYVIPSLENFEDEAALESFSEYTADEVAYMVQENVGITVDGYAYKTAIESFNSAKKSIGGITAVGDAEAAIDDDQIIVHVDVTGAKQNAQAEVIFTNDMFLSMESAALNPVESMGDDQSCTEHSDRYGNCIRNADHDLTDHFPVQLHSEDPGCIQQEG